jgi:hypothetical protein
LQSDGIEPEFCNVVLSLHMHMRRFISVACIEKETVRTRSKYGWHCFEFYTS